MTDSDSGAIDASRDEGFRAWLAMNDYLVDEDFLVFDVDGMPDDPFTEAGLRIAEAEALRRFGDSTTALLPENREMSDKFIRYIGEVFVRGLGGEWTNDPGPGVNKAYLGVRFPGVEGSLNAATLFTSALHRRDGDSWAFVYRNRAEDLAQA